ncbi:MAG: LacI family DNA-binding transcriptional regulator [Tissierellia bacterium]|nr:LacI family DNA-binding transcriptional regulator [Tissierellia bacterium]
MGFNIYDIAKEAEVSIATVSRVINNNKNVSPKTRRKVEEVIKKLDYSPNLTARSLASNKTMIIGILVTDIRNPFHSMAAYKIVGELEKYGYMSLLLNTSDDSFTKAKYLELIYKRGVDGILLVGSDYGDLSLKDNFKKVSKEIPVVFLNSFLDEDSYCIICNEDEGIKQSLRHLKKKGYKSPALIVESKSFKSRALKAKTESFKKYMNEFYRNEKIKIFELEKNNKNYTSTIKNIIEEKVDAIQFETDALALSFLTLLERLNYKVPDDIAIVGFDNIDSSKDAIKALTTIDHKINEHAILAVDKLKSLINGEQVEKRTYINPELIVRETS